MRLLHVWALIASMAAAQSGAAFAEVTVSQSNSPAEGLSTQIASVIGAQNAFVAGLGQDQVARVARGLVDPKAKKSSKEQPDAIRYEAAFLASQPAPEGGSDWQCLREALYFEARGETLQGQFAVAEVILNRVDSPRFPKSVCGVVRQRGGGSCQFSYVCDGKSDVMSDRMSLDRAGRIARLMLDGAPRRLTNGATYFHTRSVRPNWSAKFARTATIGAHLFYRAH